MVAKRLTDVGIDRLKSEGSERLEIWDALTPGLGLRVGARRKSFFVMTRVDGRPRRVTLGSFPGLRIAEAREKARHAIALAQNGVDPVEAARETKAQRIAARRNTVAATVEDFIDRHARPRQRSWKDTAARLNNRLVAAHGHKPVSALKRTDIVRLLDDVVAEGMGAGANRLLANIKTYLSWCEARGLIERSPAGGVKAPVPEVSRDRVLSDEELTAVWGAAEAIGYPYGTIVQLLILTAQRRDEVAHLAWAEIDLDAASWEIPAVKNKSARPHVVPLSAPALAIIKVLPRVGPLLFPAQTDLQGERAFSGWSRAKTRLDARSGVTGWRLHDLRRTAATGMARLGHQPHVVERVLNHATSASGPLARVYQRYAYEDEKRQALAAWAKRVRRSVAAS